MSESRKLETYKVKVVCFTKVITAEGGIAEKPEEMTVEVAQMSRLSAAHSKMAMGMLRDGLEMEAMYSRAQEFVTMLVVDDKQRELLLQDSCACFDLYTSEAVRADIDRFLDNLEVIKRMQKAQD